MALDLRLQQKMAQQLVMTPQLQQAIKLLQLNHLEMADVLREEMEQNPVLEERSEGGDGGDSVDVGDSASAETLEARDSTPAGEGEGGREGSSEMGMRPRISTVRWTLRLMQPPNLPRVRSKRTSTGSPISIPTAIPCRLPRGRARPARSCLL